MVSNMKENGAMNRADAIVLLTAPCVGLLGGLLTWLHPKTLFGPIGWGFALVGAPVLIMWLNAQPPQGYLWVWVVLYAPIACVVSAFTCSLVFGAGLLWHAKANAGAHAGWFGAIIGTAALALGTYGVYMAGTAVYLVGQH
jgi:hypothetical protein